MNPVHLALGAAIVVLAVIGLCWVLARAADGLERAWDWLRWRFRGDVGDDYTDLDPLPLPPERTWEQMTSHQLPVIDPYLQPGAFMLGARDVGLSPHRERRAPWWEVQQRAAYESLGLDYPSGLLARVREAGQ